MNFFNQMRTRMHERLLKKSLHARPIERSSISLEKARSIGILFDATQSEDKEKVLGYAKKLKASGKKVKLLAFFDSDLKSENFTFPHFNKKQLDWAFRPKPKEVEEFSLQKFDLLLNLSRKNLLPLDYIAAKSMARFRVGPSTERDFSYDLMIEPDSKKGLQAFIQQVEQYLGTMEPGNVAAII